MKVLRKRILVLSLGCDFGLDGGVHVPKPSYCISYKDLAE